MKSARQMVEPASKGPMRREWPQAAELSPIRTAAVAPASRGMAEPPVRPVPGWRLPSGQLLVEYALRAGLASSPLLVRLPLLGGGAAANGQAVSAADPVVAPSLMALSAKVGSSGRSGRAKAASPVAAVKRTRGDRS